MAKGSASCVEKKRKKEEGCCCFKAIVSIVNILILEFNLYELHSYVIYVIM